MENLAQSIHTRQTQIVSPMMICIYRRPRGAEILFIMIRTASRYHSQKQFIIWCIGLHTAHHHQLDIWQNILTQVQIQIHKHKHKHRYIAIQALPVRQISLREAIYNAVYWSSLTMHHSFTLHIINWPSGWTSSYKYKYMNANVKNTNTNTNTNTDTKTVYMHWYNSLQCNNVTVSRSLCLRSPSIHSCTLYNITF